MKEATMEQRMTRLEREIRWWRLLGVLGVLGITAVVVMGQTQPRVVVAQRFVAKDMKGKILAEWGELPDGRTALVLYDRYKNASVLLDADASLTLRTRSDIGQSSDFLGPFVHINPYWLAFYGDKGLMSQRITLGDRGLTVFNENGDISFQSW